MELYKPKKSDKPGKVGMVKVKKNGKEKIIYLHTISVFGSNCLILVRRSQ